MTNIDPELRTALEQIANYLGDDEFKNYQRTSKRKRAKHIYNAIKLVRARLGLEDLDAKAEALRQYEADLRRQRGPFKLKAGFYRTSDGRVVWVIDNDDDDTSRFPFMGKFESGDPYRDEFMDFAADGTPATNIPGWLLVEEVAATEFRKEENIISNA